MKYQVNMKVTHYVAAKIEAESLTAAVAIGEQMVKAPAEHGIRLRPVKNMDIDDTDAELTGIWQ